MKTLKIFSILFLFLGLFSITFAQDDIIINEVKTFRGHLKPVFSVAFSPDGNTLASGSYDKSVRIWDINAGRLLQTFTGHTDAVYSVAYNSSGNMLASCGKDKTIRIWDPSTGRLKKTLKSNEEVTTISFDPIRNQIASAGEKGIINIWDIDSGKKKFTLRGHFDLISSIDYSFDGAYLASGSYDKQILLWAPLAGKQLTSLPQSTASVNAISFQPNGTALIAGSSDKTVKLWEIPIGELIRTFEPGSGEIISVSFNNNGSYLACAMSDGTIGIWNVETGKIVTIFPSNHGTVNFVEFSPDGTLLTSAGSDNNIRLWKFGEKPNQPPVIVINSPVDTTTEEKTIFLSAKVMDDREIKNLVVKHNNQSIIDEFISGTEEISQTKGFAIVPTTQATTDYKFEININRSIELMPGENTFEIIAFDGELSTAERTAITYEIPLWMKGQRWAVIVGISDYESPDIPDLRYSDRDAYEFYNFIRTPNGGGFSDDHIKLLINKDATTQNIRNALFDFLKQAIEEDLVYIFFSGHGAPELDNPNNLYLVTYDTDPEKLASTAFPMWDVETALDRHIQAEKVVLLADACHSGGVGGGIGTRDIAQQNLINKYLIELMKAKPGRVTFTASEVGEVSRESQRWGGGHGCFTYYLLEGLKGAADTNQDGVVTLGEAIDYTDEHVRRATNARQHPDTSGQFDRSLPMSVLNE